jgi:hypothetical protein
MQIEVAQALMRALALEFQMHDSERQGRPSDGPARIRARGVAEKTALRRLLQSGSFVSAVAVGRESYEREMRYFSPITLLHPVQESEWESADVAVAEGESWS